MPLAQIKIKMSDFEVDGVRQMVLTRLLILFMNICVCVCSIVMIRMLLVECYRVVSAACSLTPGGEVMLQWIPAF